MFEIGDLIVDVRGTCGIIVKEAPVLVIEWNDKAIGKVEYESNLLKYLVDMERWKHEKVKKSIEM